MPSVPAAAVTTKTSALTLPSLRAALAAWQSRSRQDRPLPVPPLDRPRLAPTGKPVSALARLYQSNMSGCVAAMWLYSVWKCSQPM